VNPPYEPTVNDLAAAGYARCWTGFWMRPDGLSVVSEPDALRELAERLNQEASQR